jgi:hypothetical protein
MACDTKGRLWAGYNDGHIQVLDPELTREVFNFDIRYNELAKTKMPVESIVLFPNGHVVANSNFEFTEHANQFNCNRITEGNGIAVLGGTFNTLKAPPSSAFPVDSQARKWTIYTQERMETYTLPFNEFPLVKTFAIDQDVFFEYAINNYKILSRTHGKQLKADHSGPVQKINSIFQFPGSDSLWLATVNGLGIYQISADKLQMLNTKSWPSQYLYGLIPDRKGNMWISSNAGVIRYTPATGHWKCFDVRDGMQSNEFNTNCFALMRDDALAFGGPEGINVFDPAYFDSRHIPFRVFFTGIKINEKPVEGFNPYHEAFSFSIRPNQKSLEIEYSSTLYDDRESIHYFVQLEGAEENWVDMRDKEFVRYINLKPGDYTFRLKAVNADDEWSQNYMEARVKVIPAFFQTTWFLILCFIVLGALIYGSYTYRIRQIKKLQTVRNRISHDLHDDVGSTLGSISIYSEVAKTLSAENREDVLDKIGEASREMLDKLNDIVWSINPENDTLEKLETRMRAYAAMVLYPKAIDFTMETSSQYANTTMTMEVRRNLFLVFKEAIYNIAKYSGCRQVEIRLTESKGSIRLEIKDDGKGFDPTLQDAYNGNGLKSMKERAKAIQGTLQIISAPGAGTQILLDA